MALKYGQQYYGGFKPSPRTEQKLWGGMNLLTEARKANPTTKAVKPTREDDLKISGTSANSKALAQTLRGLNAYEDKLYSVAEKLITDLGANANDYFNSEEAMMINEELATIATMKTNMQDYVSDVADHALNFTKEKDLAFLTNFASKKHMLDVDADGQFYLDITKGFMTVEEEFERLDRTSMFVAHDDGSVTFEPEANPFTALDGSFSKWSRDNFNSISTNLTRGSSFSPEMRHINGNPALFEAFLVTRSSGNNYAQVGEFVESFLDDMPMTARWDATEISYAKIHGNIRDLSLGIIPRNLIYAQSANGAQEEIDVYQSVLDYGEKVALVQAYEKGKKPEGMSDSDFKIEVEKQKADLRAESFIINQRLKEFANVNTTISMVNMSKEYRQNESHTGASSIGGYGTWDHPEPTRYLSDLDAASNPNSSLYQDDVILKGMGVYGAQGFNTKIAIVGNLGQEYGVSPANPVAVIPKEGDFFITDNGTAIPSQLLALGKIVGSSDNYVAMIPNATYDNEYNRYKAKDQSDGMSYTRKNWDYISLSLNAAQELISREGVSKNDGATMEKVLTQGWQSYDQLTHNNGNRAFNTEAEYKNEVMRNVNVFTNLSPDGHVTVKSAKAVEAETIGQYHPAMRVKIQFSVDDIEEAIKVDNPYFGVRNGTPFIKDFDDKGDIARKKMRPVYSKTMGKNGKEQLTKTHYEFELYSPLTSLNNLSSEKMKGHLGTQSGTDNAAQLQSNFINQYSYGNKK